MEATKEFPEGPVHHITNRVTGGFKYVCWVVPLPSNSGKRRFRLESPTKHEIILVVTITGKGVVHNPICLYVSSLRKKDVELQQLVFQPLRKTRLFVDGQRGEHDVQGGLKLSDGESLGVCPLVIALADTLPETNVSPENRPLEKEIPIGNHHF